jgi:hypothetical protein
MGLQYFHCKQISNLNQPTLLLFNSLIYLFFGIMRFSLTLLVSFVLVLQDLILRKLGVSNLDM